MIITEFLEGRTVERQAVTRYIERHPEEFNGHISKKGREIDLDDIAIAILDKKYPLAKPIQVINGVDPEEYNMLQKKYMAALEEMDVLKNWKIEQVQRLADSEQRYNTLMLQSKIDKDNAVADAVKIREKELNLEHRAADQELHDHYKAEIERIQKQATENIIAEKNRKLTLKERMLGRKINE